MANDFLFELGCEELPSAAVSVLAKALADNLKTALDKAQIAYGALSSFATPRRMAVYIKELTNEQPSQRQTRRGPALVAAYDEKGQPTPALLGFAKSCNVAPSELTVIKTDKGDWLVHESLIQGAKTSELLAIMVNQALTSLPIAKPMRWGIGSHEFVRPVHWALLLYNDELIDCEIMGVKTGRNSYGHRFHHPQAIEINKAENYQSLLKKAFVIADFNERRNLIIEQVKQLASEHDAEAIMPTALIDEVCSIVEWPQALIADFEEEFLNVPAEALIASMQSHQKCFAMQNSKSQILPHFITVANIVSTDPKQVIAGNEKVMRARLSDAAFFFRQDKKQPLSNSIPATEKVVFQVKLGSLKDKANRVQALMELLITPLKLDRQQARRAAELSKCDLMTGMVGEFPELQGLMGYYYALNDGESKEVALALNEQYMPRFAADQLPSTTLGQALSFADRLDSLVGIFAIGQKPSGVKDPFKLRRHALAIVRILIANATPLNLSTWIAESLKIYGDSLPQADALIAELKPFILERMQSYYQGLGFSNDLVMAVRARQDEWLYDFDKRIYALASFVKLSEAAALSAACKRVHNILQQASQENGLGTINESLLEEGAERSLFVHLLAVEKLIEPLYANADYGQILTQLASLREPVDAFFEQVMVMVDNQAVKKNRLLLLTRLQSLLQGVADISRIMAG
ncbi:MAG: glycine--tRNA ligase subunit beta [Tatlockia sp.]|nr:glycine--tRNA ligase subunit beta [Tatlockia sp.]